MSELDIAIGKMMLDDVNNLRISRNLWPLEVHDDLSRGADQHNHYLIDNHWIGHSDHQFNDGFVENVGMGVNGDPRALIHQLMHCDPAHEELFMLEHLQGQGVAILSRHCQAGLWLLFTWRGRLKN